MADKKPTYFELLQHPNWQRKRLEVLQRNDFRCEDCESTDKILHVHHSYYEKGLAPWEYPLESLHALCVDCHRKAQDVMRDIHRLIGKLGDIKLIEVLYGFLLGFETARDPDQPIDCFSYDVAQGLALYYEIGNQMDYVAALMTEGGVIDGHALRRAAIKANQDYERMVREAT